MNRGITSVLFADDQKIIFKAEEDIQKASYIYMYILDVICKDPNFKISSFETKVMALEVNTLEQKELLTHK